MTSPCWGHIYQNHEKKCLRTLKETVTEALKTTFSHSSDSNSETHHLLPFSRNKAQTTWAVVWTGIQETLFTRLAMNTLRCGEGYTVYIQIPSIAASVSHLRLCGCATQTGKLYLWKINFWTEMHSQLNLKQSWVWDLGSFFFLFKRFWSKFVQYDTDTTLWELNYVNAAEIFRL